MITVLKENSFQQQVLVAALSTSGARTSGNHLDSENHRHLRRVFEAGKSELIITREIEVRNHIDN